MFKKSILLIIFGFLASCSSSTLDIVSLNDENASKINGKQFVKNIAACGFCHGENRKSNSILSGGLVTYDIYGELYGSNITNSESGIGTWTVNDIITYMRTGKNVHAEISSPEVHKGYEWISENDLFDMVYYLKSLPSVENNVPRRSISFIKRNTIGVFRSVPEIFGSVPPINKNNVIAYGAYVVDNVARCSYCHNSPASLIESEKYLKGGKLIKNEAGEKIAPDITQSDVYGIGSWSDDDIFNFFKKGTTPDKKNINTNFCPIEFYSGIEDQTLNSIVAYLRTVEK